MAESWIKHRSGAKIYCSVPTKDIYNPQRSSVQPQGLCLTSAPVPRRTETCPDTAVPHLDSQTCLVLTRRDESPTVWKHPLHLREGGSGWSRPGVWMWASLLAACCKTADNHAWWSPVIYSGQPKPIFRAGDGFLQHFSSRQHGNGFTQHSRVFDTAHVPFLP